MQVTPIEIVLWTSAWTAIGWLTSHRLSIVRESKIELARFRSFIDLLEQKINSTKAQNFAFTSPSEWPSLKSAIDLEKRVADIRPRIPAKYLEKFNSAFISYQSLGFAIADEKECEEQKKQLISFLEEIKDCAK